MHAERSNEMKGEKCKRRDEKQTGEETNIPIINE